MSERPKVEDYTGKTKNGLLNNYFDIAIYSKAQDIYIDKIEKQIKELKAEKQHILNAVAKGKDLAKNLKFD